MAHSAGEDENWRVMLLPGIERGKAANIKSFTLPDPRTGRPQGFLLANGSLLEINRFKQSHSAWLLADRLLADGGVFLATAYDPLFVLLPVLDRAREKDEGCPLGKFKELEELLYDGTLPGLSELLPYARGGGEAATCAPSAADAAAEGDAAAAGASECSEAAGAALAEEPAAVDDAAPEASERSGQDAAQEGATTAPVTAATAVRSGPGAHPAVGRATLACLDQQLACICDVRKVDDMSFYRLNDDRVLAWLCCKFRRMQAALTPQLAGMDAAHAAAYVLGFLAEYVGDPWVGRVVRHLGVKDEKELAAIAAANNNNTGGTLQPTDGNAMQGATRPGAPLAGPPEKKQKVDPRAASKQAALAKQAVGTKKLTSFFTKK